MSESANDIPAAVENLGRDECKMPSCDREPGAEDTDSTYNESKFCSAEHMVLYNKRKMEAEQARRDAQREAREGPPARGP